MKYTLLIAMNAALAAADTNSLKDYLPMDGADFLDTCDGDDSTAVSKAELITCMKADAPNKHYRRIDRTVDREWSNISTNDAIDEDGAKALYYSFVCSDSSDDETAQAACAVGHMHEWIDDITACPWHDDAGCTITVPAGPDGFISDLVIADAFAHMDADDDGALDADEQAWFTLRNAVAKWQFA